MLAALGKAERLPWPSFKEPKGDTHPVFLISTMEALLKTDTVCDGAGAKLMF